jgi:hypothetical protein
MSKYIVSAIAGIVGGTLAFTIGISTGALLWNTDTSSMMDHRDAAPPATTAIEQPSCPEEDSCFADYDGVTDSWRIVEGERP